MRQEMTLQNWMTQGEEWARTDPDPTTAGALRALVKEGDIDALVGCFLPPLEFGTAGLRGVVGPGPARMNLAVVRRVTRALATVVERAAAQPEAGVERSSGPIVVGFDGRADSERFAREVVGVLAKTRSRVAFFERPVPTPLVAYAAQRLQSPAAVMVTASHNPPEYNGYKVYGPDAIQIVPPFDAEVAEELNGVGAASEIAVQRDVFERPSANATRLDASIFDGYLDAVLAGRVRGAEAQPIRIAYTPLHGVGAAWIEGVFAAAGYGDLHVEPSQREIDGGFPTVRFPNPEEPATLVRGLKLARDIEADILLVNDPDADRLGAAIRTRDSGFRVLAGNEIGVVLTDYLLSHAECPSEALIASTVVSTPMVMAVASQYGARAVRTLTGFKWLWSAIRSLEVLEGKRFALCWEEALGYSTHSAVRDKDGIAAALVLADWVSDCRRVGIQPIDRLSELYRRHGAWASAPHNVVRPISSGVVEIHRMMTYLAEDPPRKLNGRRVANICDFRKVSDDVPAWRGAANMIGVELDDGARIVVRPSGTEPKLKCYSDVREEVRGGEEPLAAYERARAIAEGLNRELVQRLESVL